MKEFQSIALDTGVTLNVAIQGNRTKPPVILLHGFPESHRTWREIAPRLDDQFYLVMPDQRGFAGSDAPQDVLSYKTEVLIDDSFALANVLGLERFALIGHDWGGALGWSAAMREPERLTHLAIINAPHPLIFQRSLIENEDQRLASQYINAFRQPGFEDLVEARSYDWFFDQTFGAHVNLAKISEKEKRHYIAEWSQPGTFRAMLNWYRAAQVIVPEPEANLALPDWLLRKFPKVRVPTLVIWGMKDRALLPLQLNGLDALVDDLIIVRLPETGHFAPWEAGEEVSSKLLTFLVS